jgi:hypothetical protein
MLLEFFAALFLAVQGDFNGLVVKAKLCLAAQSAAKNSNRQNRVDRVLAWGGEKEVSVTQKKLSHFYSELGVANAAFLFPCKVSFRWFLYQSSTWQVNTFSSASETKMVVRSPTIAAIPNKSPVKQLLDCSRYWSDPNTDSITSLLPIIIPNRLKWVFSIIFIL